MDKRKKKIGSAKQIRHLAEEMIEEILSRLPVKPLLRFQLVSKAWASLIGSERFIKTHLQNSRENTDLSNHRVIYDNLQCLFIPSPRKRKINELKQYSVHSLMNDPVPDPSGLEHLSGFGIVGCCNGLVCVRYPRRESFYLWNPSTRIWFELPKLEKEISVVRTGFGWDESSGAYKVFVFLFVSGGIDRCIVYSSNTNKWEKVETDFDWGIFYSEHGVFVNGKLHWHCYSVNGVVIVSLDLKSAEMGTMDHPCDDRNLFGRRMSLGVVGGCLSVVYHRGDLREEMHVWVMKEYGVKESWFRAMAVRIHHLIPFHNHVNAFANVLGEGPDGEILISYGSFFLAYHPTKDALVSELKEIKDKDEDKDGGRGSAHLYFESLVSPERKHAKPKRITQKPIKLKDYVLT